MKKKKPEKTYTKQMEKVLIELLRTSKTLEVLASAAQGKGVMRRFVCLWLDDNVLSGAVRVLPGGPGEVRSEREFVLPLIIFKSLYPEWLDPQVIPDVSTCRVYINGKPPGLNIEDGEDDEIDIGREQPVEHGTPSGS